MVCCGDRHRHKVCRIALPTVVTDWQATAIAPSGHSNSPFQPEYALPPCFGGVLFVPAVSPKVNPRCAECCASKAHNYSTVRIDFAQVSVRPAPGTNGKVSPLTAEPIACYAVHHGAGLVGRSRSGELSSEMRSEVHKEVRDGASGEDLDLLFPVCEPR